MLALEVPILLTCFNEREKEGEQMLFGQAFEAHNLLAPRVNPFAHVVPLEVIADGNDNRMSEAAAAELVVRVAAEVDAEEARAAAARADAAAATANTGSADMEAVGRGGLRAEDIQALMSSSAARATDINSSGSGANGCACSNTYVTWVRGSSLARDALHTFAQRRASELLKTCAKLFALKNMDAWLAFLDADAPCADVNRGETVAANCMLLAEATDEIQLAALATKSAQQRCERWCGSGHHQLSMGLIAPMAQGAIGRGVVGCHLAKASSRCSTTLVCPVMNVIIARQPRLLGISTGWSSSRRRQPSRQLALPALLA